MEGYEVRDGDGGRNELGYRKVVLRIVMCIFIRRNLWDPPLYEFLNL